MPTFTPEFLARATGGIWTWPPAVRLTGFTQDTRQLSAGQVFVAIRTERRDGHDFIRAAQAAGASAALVSRVDPGSTLPQLVVPDTLAAFQAIAREHRRAFRGPVIGISGSAGKTSTKNLLAELLGGAGAVLATEGNLNNHLGVPLTLTRIDPERHAYAVIEAGIGGPGEMQPLAAMIEPDIAIITLVAPAHLEALGTLENVAREKALLPAAAAGVAIFSRECLAYGAFRDLAVRTMIVEPAEVIRPAGEAGDRVYFAVSNRGDTTGVSLAYGAPPPLMFTLRRVSEGMAHNAVLAICAALWLGIPPPVIQTRLGRWQPARLRGELRRDGDRLLYLDCYNANPSSMADALANFYQVAPAGEPRLFVLGGMEELGPEASRYHRALGRMLHLRPLDRCFVIGDHADAVRQGAIESGHAPSQIEVVGALEPIISYLAEFHGAVFIKGSRKHALERVVAESRPLSPTTC